MFAKLAAVLVLASLGLAIACAPSPDYPSRSRGETISREVEVGESPRYTIKAKNNNGSTSTLHVYEGPGFLWAEENRGLSLDLKEKAAILKVLQDRGIDVVNSRIEGGPHEGRTGRMFIYYAQSSPEEKSKEEGGGGLTVIGGGVIADLEDIDDEEIEVTENPKDQEEVK